MNDSQTKEGQVEELYAGRRATFSALSRDFTGTIDRCDHVRSDGTAIVVLALDTPLEDGQEEFTTPLAYLNIDDQEASDE